MARVGARHALDWDRYAVSSLTPQAVADGVQRILANPAKYQAMRLAGLDAARREFNWKRQAQRLLRLYERVTTNQIALG